jgi:15-cis-phytoene synthase
MAWWRERLEELDRAAAPPGEPRLRAVQRQLVERGITGLEFSKLEDAWLPMLEPFPWGQPVAEGFRMRGCLLFGIGARLLGGRAEDARAAGEFWSLADGATHCSDPGSREYLLTEARAALAEIPGRLPAPIRPLTVLAALAAYDLRPRPRLGRVGVALAHRLRGTVPTA